MIVTQYHRVSYVRLSVSVLHTSSRWLTTQVSEVRLRSVGIAVGCDCQVSIQVTMLPSLWVLLPLVVPRSAPFQVTNRVPSSVAAMWVEQVYQV